MKIDIAVCDDSMESLENAEGKIMQYACEHSLDIRLKTYYYEELLMIDINEGKICPDILFLDIHMPNINGMELAERIRVRGYTGQIIFLTVSDKHLLEAFDVQAFNYIVKNETTPERFEKVLEKSIAEAMRDKSEYIILSKAGEIRKIALDEIRYFEVIKRISIVHYGEEEFEFYSPIGKIEDRLFGKEFVRIHKSYLVSMQYIKSIMKKEIALTTGEILPIGRNYYGKLRTCFGAYGQSVSLWDRQDEQEGEEAGGRKSG